MPEKSEFKAEFFWLSFWEIRESLDIICGVDEQGNPLHYVDLEPMLIEAEACARKASAKEAQIDTELILKRDVKNLDELKGIWDEALDISIDDDDMIYANEDLESLYDDMKICSPQVPFMLDVMNEITVGGFETETINFFMSGTGVGKTMTMVSLGNDYIKSGKNVLYITLEITGKKVFRRHTANLLDITYRDLVKTDEDGDNIITSEELVKKYKKQFNEKDGKFIIKKLPAESNINDISKIIKTIKRKKDFIPDVLIIDYINLLGSSNKNAKKDGKMNSNEKLKYISRELADLASDEKLIVLSATQTNRSGVNGDQVTKLDGISEAISVAQAADFICDISKLNGEENKDILVITPLKQRNGGEINKSFAIGVDYDKQKLYDLNDEKLKHFNENINGSKEENKEEEIEEYVVTTRKNNRKRRNN